MSKLIEFDNNGEIKTTVKALTTLFDRARVLAGKAADIINESKGLTVTNDDQKSNMLELLKKIKGVSGDLEAERTAQKKPILDAGRDIDSAYKAEIEPLTRAESYLKSAVLKYDQEQRRKAEELQAKLRAQAEEAARKEREKLAKQAEAAAAKGKDEKADELRDRAMNTLAFVPVIQTVETKTAGVSSREVWKYRITDPALLPREYLIPNDALLSGFARSTKGNIPVAGVEFYAESVLAVSSR